MKSAKNRVRYISLLIIVFVSALYLAGRERSLSVESGLYPPSYDDVMLNVAYADSIDLAGGQSRVDVGAKRLLAYYYYVHKDDPQTARRYIDEAFEILKSLKLKDDDIEYWLPRMDVAFFYIAAGDYDYACKLFAKEQKKRSKDGAFIISSGWYAPERLASGDGLMHLADHTFRIGEEGSIKTAPVLHCLYVIEAARRGNSDAQNLLGGWYESGYVSYKEKKYWSNAFEDKKYENNLLVWKDRDRAHEWYRKSAESGDRAGCYNLGVFYENDSVYRDLKKAIGAYRCGINANSDACRIMLAEILYSGVSGQCDYDEAFKLYSETMPKSDFAKVRVGECYMQGRGVERNIEKAVEIFLDGNLSRLSRTVADFNLGMCYYQGLHFEQDYRKAFEYFMKASEISSAAMNMISRYYRFGVDGVVEKDLEKAGEWQRRAAVTDLKLAEFIKLMAE